MRLLGVDVEHFACIRAASLELGPGLNVLFGPNDLGKSTLARAIRAALLIPHTSSFAQAFVAWDDDQMPSVKVTLQLPEGRVWRIEKRFGTSGGSSLLRESTDGHTFSSPYKRAREVDEELRTQLGWGIACPATRGAPRGLPTSFLATVLLGEQGDVAAVLRQTLEGDSDDSGRERLTRALAACAQDPLFKSILEEAQEQVDQAFTPTGRKKQGRASPFREVAEDVKSASAELKRIRGEVEQSEEAKRELVACNQALRSRHDELETATREHEALVTSLGQQEARQRVEQELASAREDLRGLESQVAALREREASLAEKRQQTTTAQHEEELLARDRESLVVAQREAEEAVRRASSGEAEQARRIRRGELERQHLELEAESATTQHDKQVAEEARACHEQLNETALRAAKSTDAARQAMDAVRTALAEKGDIERRLQLVDVARRVERRRLAEASVGALQQTHEKLGALQTRLKQLRHEAHALRATTPALLADETELGSMQELERELQLAEARLGRGLSVVVDRLQPVSLEGSADGKPLVLPQDGAVTVDAVRGAVLKIGNLARIRVTAGEHAARDRAAALRARWDATVVPALARLGAEDLATLLSRAEDAKAIHANAAGLDAEVANLEHGVALNQARLEDLPARQRELHVAESALGGMPIGAAADLLDGLEGGSLDDLERELRQRLAATAKRHDAAATEARSADTDAAVLEERRSAAQLKLAGFGVTEPAGGWQILLGALHARLESNEADQKEIAAAIQALDAEQGAEVGKAEGLLIQARDALAAIEARLALARDTLAELRDDASRLEGEIVSRRAAVAALDLDAARRRVDGMSARLDTLPSPDRIVGTEELSEASGRVEDARLGHERARDDARKAEGALQTVGGQVLVEQKETAQDALRRAEQREREVEVEYEAWKLLVDALREAENTEGQHLGEALGQPVSARFAALTAGRYGELQVDPALKAEGLRVAGVLRDVETLSAGTQDQLATLLRLTIAEQLGSTLLLDDHLAQTDPARSAWFRDVLREHASDAQVIVLTCRPADYLQPEDFPGHGQAVANRAGGLIRAVDLSAVIERAGAGRVDPRAEAPPQGW